MGRRAQEIYRPSAIVRWPLRITNFLILLVLAGIGSVTFLVPSLNLPWAPIWVGGSVCFFFLLLNLTMLSLKLSLDKQRARLTIWLWRRQIPWKGCELYKIVRPIGITAVRLISADGRRLWIGSGWFKDFEKLHTEMERLTRKNSGRVSLAPR